MPNEVRIWDGTQWVLVSGVAGRVGDTGSAGGTGAASTVPGPQGARGSRWYTGAGSPDAVPLANWTPNAATLPPQSGDYYLNTLDGTYSEMS